MQAQVTHRKIKRKARGFSCKEIIEAGMSCKQFDEFKLHWDPMRKTKYAENITYLKSLVKK